MALEEGEAGVESHSSTATSPYGGWRNRLEVYNDVLRRLRDAGLPDAMSPDFGTRLRTHFYRLPARYGMDVNVERAEDVMMHMKLLEKARNRNADSGPAFYTRLIQVPVFVDGTSADSVDLSATGEVASKLVHLPPAFGPSTNLDPVSLEDSCSYNQVSSSSGDNAHHSSRIMHEITFASDDKPKLLRELTSLLGKLGLNIQEAHAFSTSDGYSLDVFVVDGWPCEGTEQLHKEIMKKTYNLETDASTECSSLPLNEQNNWTGDQPVSSQHIDENDVWEIDLKLLNFGVCVASGAYGDLYRGTYCSQDVAIKMLRPEHVNADVQREFAQEVYIMRKVRHKNVVQFLGACTRQPKLCIVTEFMSGGSIYDFIHRNNGSFKLPTLLRVLMDVSKGMDYLHQKNIIHRDLKTANLLMDENKVVKVGDFGVARVKAQSGVMTAETGTYRWMAPEVIEHRPYDHKADVFSFGIVLWELLTGKIPYESLTPLQAAVGVIQKGLRPTIPEGCHPTLAKLLEMCWHQDPSERPDFTQILDILRCIAKEIGDDADDRRKAKSSGGFFSALRRGH